MRSDWADKGAPPDPSAEWRSDPDGEGGARESLVSVSDGLLHAYQFAQDDGDPQLVEMIEQALFHVGCRLAADLNPMAVGLPCH